MTNQHRFDPTIHYWAYANWPSNWTTCSLVLLSLYHSVASFHQLPDTPNTHPLNHSSTHTLSPAIHVFKLHFGSRKPATTITDSPFHSFPNLASAISGPVNSFHSLLFFSDSAVAAANPNHGKQASSSFPWFLVILGSGDSANTFGTWN